MPENLHAYIAGLQPGEVFKITGYPLSWLNRPGRRYAVYSTTNLSAGFTFRTNLPWSSAQYSDFIHTNASTMFYRMDVELDL